MKVSKTKFMNYIRCERFVALNEVAYKTGNALVTFYDDFEDIDSLYSFEQQEKKRQLVESVFEELGYTEENFDDSDFDPLQKEDKLHELLKPVYEEIERLSALKVQELFGGKIIYSAKTIEQKYFEKEVEDYRFFAFLDGYHEDDKEVKIIETKATTSRKFLDLGYKSKGELESVFSVFENGILRLKHEIGAEIVDEKKYMANVDKLFDRFSSCGKYIYDLAYQRYIVEEADKNKKPHRYYLSVLNADYVYDGKTEKDGKNHYNPSDIMVLIDLTDVTSKLKEQIKKDLKLVSDRLNTMNAAPVALGEHCQLNNGPRECPFKEVCFKDKLVPKWNSLFVYRNSHHPFKDSTNNEKHKLLDLINDGLTEALKIPREWLNKKQQIQYDVIQDKVTHIEGEMIKKGIASLKYPLYHLDFETFASPLPRFFGEKPYQQSLFQFSLHIEREPGKCDKDKDNYYFLAETHHDLREELAKKMIEYIKPDGGNVVVYNKGFESARINELITHFPKYRSQLLNIRNRIFDMLYLVRGSKEFYMKLGYSQDDVDTLLFYAEKLQRSYSIKKVLPIFAPHLDYSDLHEVHNGLEAQAAYFSLESVNDNAKAELVKNMIEYCKQDTWAMVEILNALRKLVN